VLPEVLHQHGIFVMCWVEESGACSMSQAVRGMLALPEGERNEADTGGDVAVKSLEIRYSWLFSSLEEAELALSWAARVTRDGEDERNGSHGGDWVYNRSCLGPNTEIPAKFPRLGSLKVNCECPP